MSLTIGTRVRVTLGEHAKRRVQLDPLPDGAVERAPLIPEDELRAIAPAPRPGPGFGQLSLFDLEVA